MKEFLYKIICIGAFLGVIFVLFHCRLGNIPVHSVQSGDIVLIDSQHKLGYVKSTRKDGRFEVVYLNPFGVLESIIVSERKIYKVLFIDALDSNIYYYGNTNPN